MFLVRKTLEKREVLPVTFYSSILEKGVYYNRKCSEGVTTMAKKHIFKKVEIASEDQINNIQEDGWVYRGQKNATWGLITTLERACESYNISPKKASIVEEILLREFRRKYHHYSQHIPDKENTLEWLSVMQHYGAPTRLLDFTYSFYVAAYFALEEVLEEKDTYKGYAVWAINGNWSVAESAKRFERGSREYKFLVEPLEDEKDKADAFNSIFRADPPKVLACQQNPFRLNERLTIQKGVFMCPGKVALPFEDNLCELSGWREIDNIKKVIIPHKFRRKVLNRLYDMNITRATLFPGLDGFSQSLKVSIPKRWDLQLTEGR
jgi:hypothetical protein